VKPELINKKLGIRCVTANSNLLGFFLVFFNQELIMKRILENVGYCFVLKMFTV